MSMNIGKIPSNVRSENPRESETGLWKLGKHFLLEPRWTRSDMPFRILFMSLRVA